MRKKTYIIRLDDASSKMNIKNWRKIETLLDKYDIKPIVGIIPKNLDSDFQIYDENFDFVNLVKIWMNKNWNIAMHGYNHVFHTNDSGINPVNNKSEFAGLPLKEQQELINKSYNWFKENNIIPKIFFAPAHTFDLNTIKAIKDETNIRIISDTIANDIYFENDFFFIPQQAGKVRNLPFKTTTFCYHPNYMQDFEFVDLENFIKKNKKYFTNFELRKRNKSAYDKLLNKMYFIIRNLKKRRKNEK